MGSPRLGQRAEFGVRYNQSYGQGRGLPERPARDAGVGGIGLGDRPLGRARSRRQHARGIFFGKGFGDLPDNLAWLRPFGITGAVTLEHPVTGSSINFGVDPLTGQLAPMLTRNVDILHWGFALEFSTLYLTNRFTPGKLPKDEPLNQLVPLVEFSFDSPRGEKTIATMNPGLSYVAVSWQL